MSYPSVKDDNFQERINKKYNRFKVPKKRKTFNQICYPKEYKLQIPQQFLAKYINPKTPYKGILIFHRIGAGKTCTAVNIGEHWKRSRKIVVVVPASLKGNFRAELRSPCAGNAYLTKDERQEIKTLHPSSSKYKEIVKRSDERIDKHYRIYSYNKFVEDYQSGLMNLRNSILIVDEVQNMVSETGKFYQVLYDAIHEAPSSLRVVLLSATPMFDKPIEIALTMNLLRIPLEFPTGSEFDKNFIKCTPNPRTGRKYCEAQNLDMFKEMITGFVSYFRGAPPYAFPEAKIRYVKCVMSSFQYRSYLTVKRKEEKRTKFTIHKRHKVFKYGQIRNLPSNFFIGTRMISNIAFPNKGVGEHGYKSFEGKYLNFNNLQNYSIKFYKIMRKIMRSPGPAFFYSNFKSFGGIESFIKVLEYHGYRNYTEFGEGRKRFAVWTGDEKQEIREEIKEVYNQPDNYNGSKLRVILGSPSMKEGVSLRNCRQIHILEPYWNWSRMQQIIGRGVRYCSHKQLDPEQRNVDVFIYLTVHPNEIETIDQYIQKLALQKNKLISQFEHAMKEVAVDCDLFKNANVYPEEGDENIQCEA